MSDIEYSYRTSSASHTCSYLWETATRVLDEHFRGAAGKSKRVFDLGCGNGAFAAHLAARGYTPVGLDPSESGVAIARAAHPGLQFEVGSAYDDMSKFGQFPAVTSLEVVEHVYAPRDYARGLFQLVEPGGIAVISTPYNGYWKNLAIALLGKYDQHYTALWDHGHIKFWSVRTLTTLVEEAGFRVGAVYRVGRVPPLAKSMILVLEKPRAG